MSIRALSFPPKILAAPLSSTGVRLILPDITHWNGDDTLTSGEVGTVIYATLMNFSKTRMEIMELDASTISVATTTGILINKRRLSYTGGTSADAVSFTDDSDDWTANETIVQLGTNPPQLHENYVDLDEAQTITATKTLTSTNKWVYDAPPTFSANEELITKKYADDLAIAGAPDSSTIVKGIVEEATQAELLAATAAGGTGARLFVNPSLFATSGVSKALISKTDGKIDDSLVALTTAGDLPYSDGAGLQRLALGSVGKYLHVNSAGTAPEWARPDGQFGGSGTDGALSASSGTTTLDINGANYLVKNYSSISLTGTADLAFSNPAADGSIIILRSLGDVTITSSATRAIDLRSLGGSAGAAATAGTTVYEVVMGDVARGGAGVNQSSVDPANGGAIYTGAKLYTTSANHVYRRYVLVSPGSGGGGGGAGVTGAGGAGGRGAGALIIECGGALNITGVIDASGANGTAGATGGGTNSAGAGGGGGAGGGIVILYRTLTANTGTYTVTGGNGGAGGANGAGGTGGSGGGGGGTLQGAGGKGGVGSVNGASPATAGSNAAGTGGGTGGTITAGNNGNGGGGGGGAGGWSLVASATGLI